MPTTLKSYWANIKADNLRALYNCFYGTEQTEYTFLTRTGSISQITVANLLAYGELSDLHQLRTYHKVSISLWKHEPEEEELLFSFWGIHILVNHYARIHSIAILKHECLTSLPWGTEQLQVSLGTLKGSEGIRPQGWGWTRPLRLLQAFSSCCFLRMAVRSQDLACVLLSNLPNCDLSIFFLICSCLLHSGIGLTEAERNPLE